MDKNRNLNLSIIYMAQMIIGRDAEKNILQDMLASGEAELIAILGRRRGGGGTKRWIFMSIPFI
jgi:hypothetical protein